MELLLIGRRDAREPPRESAPLEGVPPCMSWNTWKELESQNPSPGVPFSLTGVPARSRREPPDFPERRRMVESPGSPTQTQLEMLLGIVSKVTQYNEENFPRFYTTTLVLLKNCL